MAKAKNTPKKKDERTRNWAMIVYPESAPKNWRDILDNIHVPYVVSPLHDKDINPDKSKKKPHWHVILIFDNKKSFDQVKEIADKLNAPIPQKCQSLRGYIRYLVHTDNPEKYQYDRQDIENHGAGDLTKYFETASLDRQTLFEIVDYIRDNAISNFADLIYYVRATENQSWFDVLANKNTVFIKAVIDGEYHKQRDLSESLDDGVEGTAQEVRKQMQRNGFQKNSKQSKTGLIRQLRAQGASQKTIADTLGISERTVRKYLTGK